MQAGNSIGGGISDDGQLVDEMHIIDKQSLVIVKTLDPAPGKTVAHTEFTRDRKHALVSVWEQDGALIVCDAKTLEEVVALLQD